MNCTLEEMQLHIAYDIADKINSIKREDFRDKSIEETLKPSFLEVIQKKVNNLSNETKNELIDQIRKEVSSEETLQTYFFQKLYTKILKILLIDNEHNPMTTFYLEQTVKILMDEDYLDQYE